MRYECYVRRFGLSLRLCEWRVFRSLLPAILEAFPALESAHPCDVVFDDANQHGWIDCMECNPFGTEIHIDDFSEGV